MDGHAWAEFGPFLVNSCAHERSIGSPGRRGGEGTALSRRSAGVGSRQTARPLAPRWLRACTHCQYTRGKGDKQHHHHRLQHAHHQTVTTEKTGKKTVARGCRIAETCTCMRAWAHLRERTHTDIHFRSASGMLGLDILPAPEMQPARPNDEMQGSDVGEKCVHARTPVRAHTHGLLFT